MLRSALSARLTLDDAQHQLCARSHNGLMTIVVAQNEVDREIRDGDIVRARLDGATYREISEQFDLSISQCQRIVEVARARRRGGL